MICFEKIHYNPIFCPFSKIQTGLRQSRINQDSISIFCLIWKPLHPEKMVPKVGYPDKAIKKKTIKRTIKVKNKTGGARLIPYSENTFHKHSKWRKVLLLLNPSRSFHWVVFISLPTIFALFPIDVHMQSCVLHILRLLCSFVLLLCRCCCLWCLLVWGVPCPYNATMLPCVMSSCVSCTLLTLGSMRTTLGGGGIWPSGQKIPGKCPLGLKLGPIRTLETSDISIYGDLKDKPLCHFHDISWCIVELAIVCLFESCYFHIIIISAVKITKKRVESRFWITDKFLVPDDP